MTVIAVHRTTDGRYRIYLHHDHTADLCRLQGDSTWTEMQRAALYRVTDRLAELGYGPDDLVAD